MNLECQWTVYRTRFLVRARQLTEPLVFADVLGREQSGRPGDYLVEFSDGIKRITPKAIFKDVYVPLAPANFDSVARRIQTHGAPAVVTRPLARASPENRTRATA